MHGNSSNPVNPNAFKDYRGVLWMPGPDGYLVPAKSIPLTSEDRRARRNLRLQRTFGWGMFAVMGISYLLDKFVF